MRSRPPPSSFHNGRPSALPLMSHSATSIADIAIVKMPAGPDEPAASRNFAAIASTRSGSSPIDQRAELVDRVAQGAGQRAAEIGDAEPLDPVIGAQLAARRSGSSRSGSPKTRRAARHSAAATMPVSSEAIFMACPPMPSPARPARVSVPSGETSEACRVAQDTPPPSSIASGTALPRCRDALADQAA